MKYTSTTNPALKFFIEETDDRFWAVMTQVDGFPAHEVWDDWMADRAGAECIAEQLANGEIPLIHKCGNPFGHTCQNCSKENGTIRTNLEVGIVAVIFIAVIIMCLLFPNGFKAI